MYSTLYETNIIYKGCQSATSKVTCIPWYFMMHKIAYTTIKVISQWYNILRCLRLYQECYWRFKSSGMWWYFIRWVFPTYLTGHSYLSWTALLWRWWHWSFQTSRTTNMTVPRTRKLEYSLQYVVNNTYILFVSCYTGRLSVCRLLILFLYSVHNCVTFSSADL